MDTTIHYYDEFDKTCAHIFISSLKELDNPYFVVPPHLKREVAPLVAKARAERYHGQPMDLGDLLERSLVIFAVTTSILTQISGQQSVAVAADSRRARHNSAAMPRPPAQPIRHRCATSLPTQVHHQRHD